MSCRWLRRRSSKVAPCRFGERTSGPSGGLAHRVFDLCAFGFAGRTHVEHHRDGRSQEALHPHGLFRGEPLLRTVEVGAKGHAVVVDLVHVGQAEDLKAAAVGEERVWPTHELGDAATPVDQLRAWPQPQVVGVREDEAGAGRFHLGRGEPLHGAVGAHRHERRRLHDRARRRERAGPRVSVLARLLEEEPFGRKRGVRSRRHGRCFGPGRRINIASP
jgi:hypothetical protein